MQHMLGVSLSLLAFLLQICPVMLVAGCQAPGPFQAFQSPQFMCDRKAHTPILDDDFATWIEETGKRWGMKGVAVAVIRKDQQGNGWTTETKGYGVADRFGNKVDEESLFTIASNSKLFTALAIGMLISNESLPIEWNSKIKDLLPQSMWTLQDNVAQERANLIDVLSHRTGLPRHDLSHSSGETVISTLEKLRYLRPSAEFRDVWQYNNKMYMLASHIVSRLSGVPFTTYVMRNIMSPLGLSSTTYNITQAKMSGKLTDGFVNAGKSEKKGEGPGKLRFRPIPFTFNEERDMELNAGDGGVLSNAKDMATWLHALLLSGRSPSTGDIVIPFPAIEMVGRGVTVNTPVSQFPELSPVVYGMGQTRYTYQGHELIEHGGAVYGQHSVLVRFPHDGLAVAVLTNWDYGSIFEQIIKWRIVDKALNLKQINWNERYRKNVDVSEPTIHDTPHVHEALPLSVPYKDLTGIYYNPAYGALELCAYPPPQAPTSSHEECDELMLEAQSALRPLLNDSATTLLASWEKIGSTHVLLRHFSGGYFNASAVAAFPAPFPDAPKSDDESHPFAIELGVGQAQFVIRNGVGKDAEKVEGVALKGVWGAGPGVQSPEHDCKEGAEVWFDRVV